MPYLRVRYRHEVKCRETDCGELVVEEGRTSDVMTADGAPVKLEPGDRDRDLRCAFLLHCPAGHEVDLYAPRDLQVIKSGSASDPDFQPIIMRSSLAQ
jgi:hypothetical protein